MTLTKLNATAATLTKNRTEGSVSPFSGMCVTCVDGCVGMCEIGKSAYRGHEVIYPQPFGIITTAAEKDYPVDYSYLTILGTAVGVVGADIDKGKENDLNHLSDRAIFPKVSLETEVGNENKLKLRLPFVIPGLGSTNIAKTNWEGIAIGSALAGTIITIGENVVGMDVQSTIQNGKVTKAPDLEWRIKTFFDWQREGYGDIVVQSNVEDTRLGIQEFALKKCGVQTVELKWGQGAKDIGGEVKLKSLEKAQLLYKRGYVVLPNPTDPIVIESFKKGSFREFERHSRLGMVTKESFLQRVQELRDAGAKRVFLKTGAYRPADLARAIKFASLAKIDMLTIDGAGGGTGMSPWRMMNEWGIPSLEIHSLTHQYCERLAKKGEYLPDIALAGGFTFEDQIFKALALCAPYAKMVGMARSPLAAAMVGKTIGKRLDQGDLPVFIERFGMSKDEIFVTAPELREAWGDKFNEIPTSAIGVYTYYERLAQGMRQLMAGARKFKLEYMTRDDLGSLTRDCEAITGIPYIMDIDKEEVDQILDA
ncbi:MAG: FMN-binding glutamate synthase family protein [Candidatus Coatesbacteria bacterium]|nr:FMN-binding glutamate synthase family protein [Candidatus Coatesbacteria bacterium]